MDRDEMSDVEREIMLLLEEADACFAALQVYVDESLAIAKERSALLDSARLGSKAEGKD